jgi:TolB protein
MNADGTGVHALADLGLGGTATWSPDGTRLVFDLANDLYVVNVDGSGLTNLTASSAAEGMASFSPDGEHIAFVSAADGRNGEIYVMNQDGSNVVRLTENTAQDVRPLWSPDGSHIAFISDRDGTMDIYVMNADGTDQTRITTDISLSMNWFVWSPARFDKAPDGSGVDSGAPTVQPLPTATTLPPTTPGETANLAPDPSFEASEGPRPGWTFYAGSQSILGGGNVDSVTAHSGSRSLRITGRVSSNTAGECLLPSDVGTWRTTSPIQINVEKSYVFSVWHLGDAIGSAAVLSVTLLDNSGMTLAEGGISFTTLAPGWATGSLTIGSSSFPYPRGTDSVLLSLGYAFSVQQPLRDACPEGDTASIWYDDVALQEVP